MSDYFGDYNQKFHIEIIKVHFYCYRVLGLFALPTADKEVTCAPLYTNITSPVRIESLFIQSKLVIKN